MLLLGLTGGIGSGKSTVSAEFARRGAIVIDADLVVRELQSPGGAVLAAMVEHFGDTILAADGTLNRQAVADIVFNDPEQLKALNAIVHPKVGEEIDGRIEAQRESDNVVILDVPLLVESKAYETEGIIVVDTDPEIAVQRLVEFRGFNADDARARMKLQATREERRAVAAFIVPNDGTQEDLMTHIEECWIWIQSKRNAG
ncbi:MAG: dephospho-CoA kinase [Actinomycetia bacterium]|jgi:dephospho-CoA kinase|nr:dephospho-CoA kinase [Actinomycetes bacterium]